MDFDTFMDQAWTDHANDAAAVATRLDAQALALVTEMPQTLRLAHLAHHVMGEHLARWHDGLRFLQQLAALPLLGQDQHSGTSGALRRYQASLRLAGGLADERGAFTPSESIRITAMAAASLGCHDAARASTLLADALAQTEAAELPDADPAHRVLAISGNSIAGTLEEKPGRSTDETALMLRAAQVARQFWARAGTWLETERAEYRLAMSWCQAADWAQARQHAQHCLEIVLANGSVPLEVFFGWEALGTVERAAGNATGHSHALAQARAAYATLEDSDKGWCQASLDKLGAA
ncbi:MAG: hypothetical protein KA141_03615 [Rubrivivax sp.]|nr:hypothetical protein [Rubrivivax sp.]